MIQNLNEQIKEYGRKHRFHGRWVKALMVMACVVVFCTMYALLLPAITLDNTATCGMEEHSHSSDCYEQKLVCGLEEGENAHTHGEDCYDEEGNLICGLEESSGHAHTEDCYESVLTCSIPEHTHSEACFTQEDAEPSETDPETPDSEEEEKSEEEPEEIALTQQTVNAAVYTDGSLAETLAGVSIQITGQLPEGVAVKAYPVSATLDDENATVIEAYDIGLFVPTEDGEEKEYEPDSKVEVTIRSEKLKDVETVNVYHIDDADDANPNPQPELVTDGIAVTEGNEVTFDAAQFSAYVLTDAGSEESIETDSVEVSAADSSYTVTYVVDSDPEKIGSSSYYSADNQTWKDQISVKNLSGLEETVGNDETYTVKDVSSQTRVAEAKYQKGMKGNILFTYTFLYWSDSDGRTYKAGDKLTLTGDLTLTAKWCVHFNGSSSSNHSDTELNTAAFYIAISSDVNQATGANNYTDCLFTTRINGENAENAARTNDTKLYGSDDRTGYVSYNKQIRESGVFTEFPSDDEIFAMIRTWSSRASNGCNTSITVNNKTYEADEITADNFDIYWFVVKSSTGDSWHVDGLLMPKEAKLTVTKTFIGNEDAVQKAQQNYNVTVNDSATSYTLNLTDSSDNDNVTLYHDEGSNTYTWVLTGLKQLTEYTVKENNYNVNGYNVAASYQVTNSRTGYNTSGWQTYDTTGVKVKCSGYQNDVDYTAYQTVSLRNVYTKPYVMTILKQDGTTYNGLNNVSFALTVNDSEGREEINETVTTNSDGQIEVNFQQLGGGTYTFTLAEQSYEGYQALATITGKATVDNDGTVKVSDVKVDITGDNTLVSVDNTDLSIVYIQNISERTSVTVNKVWTDGTNKQVTMQLVRNGIDVTGKTVVLSSDNEWTHTWTDLPLYVDGKEASYTVRETWIGRPGEAGSSSYTESDDADGYKDYIVTTSNAKDEEGNTTITVTNTKDNGQVVFTKVDESGNALAGAKFTVYTDENCETAATINGKNAVFTSDENGLVTIVGLSTGTYYVKETSAPSGYAASDTVYMLIVKGNNSTLTAQNGNTVSKVVNEKSRTDFTLKKVDANDTNTTLNGAVFTLTNSEGKYYSSANNSDGSASWQDEKNEITVSEGTYTFSGLECGTYTLTETKAPDGYNLLTDKITVTVSPNGMVTAAYGSGGSNNIAEATTSDDGVITVTVKNSTGTTLPTTGGPGITKYTTGGLFLMLTALAGCLMYNGWKRRRGGAR